MLLTVLKAITSLALIFLVGIIAKKYSALAGMIAVMPIIGLLILIWTYVETKGAKDVMVNLTTGAMIGLVPTAIFYIAAFITFSRGMSITPVMLISFAAWGVSAFIILRLIH